MNQKVERVLALANELADAKARVTAIEAEIAALVDGKPTRDRPVAPVAPSVARPGGQKKALSPLTPAAEALLTEMQLKVYRLCQPNPKLSMKEIGGQIGKTQQQAENFLYHARKKLKVFHGTPARESAGNGA